MTIPQLDEVSRDSELTEILAWKLKTQEVLQGLRHDKAHIVELKKLSEQQRAGAPAGGKTQLAKCLATQ